MTDFNKELDLLNQYMDEWIDDKFYQEKWWDLAVRCGIFLYTERTMSINIEFFQWKLMQQ